MSICAEVSGATAFAHDYALDGDEDLCIGMTVTLHDGDGTVQAVVSRRDEEAGYWFFEVTP